MTTTEFQMQGGQRIRQVGRKGNRYSRVPLLFSLLAVSLSLLPIPGQAQNLPSPTPTPPVITETTPPPPGEANALATPTAEALEPGGTPEADGSIELHIPSAQPSGIPVNDQIWMSYYRAGIKSDEVLSLSPRSSLLLDRLHSPSKTPAVILLHYLGATENSEMNRLARFLSGQGIVAVVVTLPYHMKRLPDGDSPLHHFVDGQVSTSVQALSQSASDVSTVISWLERQPRIDPQRIALIGASLGAIVTHLVMGQDSRVSAGVAMLGGGDLVRSYTKSLAAKLVVKRKLPDISPADQEQLRSVDPLTYAKNNQPRKVLMVQGARDFVIPPQSAEELWEALGKPPIQWIDTNHLALRYAQKSAARAATEFLIQMWSDVPLDEVKVPRIQVPTVTAGFVFGLDEVVTPAVQLELFGIGTHHHLPILHGNLGMGLSGPFAGVAATVNQFVDVGIGRRFYGNDYKPYVSTHFAF